MPLSTHIHPLALLLLLALSLVGCHTQEEGRPLDNYDHRHQVSELRPTDPDDPMGYDGAEVTSIESPEGYLRVWYALDGIHQPPQADTNDSGIPDYVELAATIGDEVGMLIEAEGWRRPLSGQSLRDDQPLDLYLIDFDAGDGNFRPEYCGQLAAGQAEGCAGHLRLENDFAPLYYPSREYALKVVLSHEYFHAIQYAYNAEIPPWWSEGSASWFEEYYWDEQNDFERLTGYFFDEFSRALNDRQRGPFDAFSYGAGLFAYFLDVHFSPDILLQIHEELALDATVEEALDLALTSRDSSLHDAFIQFALFNAFTGDRAVDDQGYPQADRFDQVELVAINADQAANWNVEAEALSAQYAHLTGNRPISLQLEAIDDRPHTTAFAISEADFQNGLPPTELSYDAPINVDADAFPLLVMVTNTDPTMTRYTRVLLRSQQQPRNEDPDDLSTPDQNTEDSGCATTGTSHPSHPSDSPLFFLLIAGLAIHRRKAVRAVVRARPFAV